MTGMTLGDLARSYMLQTRGLSLRSQATDLSKELTTGYVANVRDVLGGNVSYLADIERDLSTLEGYKIARLEADSYATSVQQALEAVQIRASDLGASLLTTVTSPTSLEQSAFEAQNALEAMLAKLNTDVGGRSLFAGTATKTAAVDDATTLLNTLEIIIAGAATAADARLAAETWFNDPAGFSGTIYTGSQNDLSPFRVADGEEVVLGVRADDPALREALMNTALAALSESTALTLSLSERAALLRDSGVGLQSNQEGLITLRAQIGTGQAQLDRIATRNAAAQSSLEMARNDLLGVDPYETASKLEDVRFRLEAIYTVTARLSGLKLVNFL